MNFLIAWAGVLALSCVAVAVLYVIALCWYLTKDGWE